jgi:hypothetical protein
MVSQRITIPRASFQNLWEVLSSALANNIHVLRFMDRKPDAGTKSGRIKIWLVLHYP